MTITIAKQKTTATIDRFIIIFITDDVCPTNTPFLPRHCYCYYHCYCLHCWKILPLTHYCCCYLLTFLVEQPSDSLLVLNLVLTAPFSLPPHQHWR